MLFIYKFCLHLKYYNQHDTPGLVFKSVCVWMIGGHTIHKPIEGMLLHACIETTSFQNSASNVAGLQVHYTTLACHRCMPLHPGVC